MAKLSKSTIAARNLINTATAQGWTVGVAIVKAVGVLHSATVRLRRRQPTLPRAIVRRTQHTGDA